MKDDGVESIGVGLSWLSIGRYVSRWEVIMRGGCAEMWPRFTDENVNVVIKWEMGIGPRLFHFLIGG